MRICCTATSASTPSPRMTSESASSSSLQARISSTARLKSPKRPLPPWALRASRASVSSFASPKSETEAPALRRHQLHFSKLRFPQKWVPHVSRLRRGKPRTFMRRVVILSDQREPKDLRPPFAKLQSPQKWVPHPNRALAVRMGNHEPNPPSIHRLMTKDSRNDSPHTVFQ